MLENANRNRNTELLNFLRNFDDYDITITILIFMESSDSPKPKILRRPKF